MLVGRALSVRVPVSVGVRAPTCVGVRAKHTAAATIFDPVVRHALSAPEVIGLVHSGVPCPYLLTIVGFTVLLRSAVSLPLLSWQRKRNERLARTVLPEWSVWKKQIPASIWKRLAPTRKVGPEMERHLQRQIQRSLQEKWVHLTQLYDCSPLKTTLVSLSVHLPVFIAVTMLIRQGALLPDSPFLNEIVPWWSPDPDFAAQMAAQKELLLSKGLPPQLAERITSLGGPTLADRDTTMALPVILGAVNMLNVELAAFMRQRRMQRDDAIGLGSPSAAAQRDPVVDQLEIELKEPLSSRMLTTAARLGSIISIPIACQVPSALLVYWLTSSLFTLGQTIRMERLEAKE
ncbi:hypothetical protein MCUN1_001017 [Malassezia cuniculi]|uniref:Membrane insertase YidC/Oxa/ALB C-terminal domain-containing protein n=1 Tax=Malassezia cuniculi TaxID=948313 RepID=A0AAF0EPY0_9BASI|nr:hypothetical protein MCUN1_001017 [Malassezia cuniculi]